MTTINRDFTDSITISDTFSSVLSPERYTETLEELISLSDTFTEAHTEHIEKSYVDQIAVSDLFTYVTNNSFFRDFTDTIFVSDLVSEIHKVAPILNITDVVNLTDTLVSNLNEQFGLSISDIINVDDIFSYLATLRVTKEPVELASVSDDFSFQYGIRVTDGTVGGSTFNSYDVGTQVALAADVIPNKVFFRWEYSKVGIDNIYDTNATLTVPQGGGLITATYIELETEDDVVVVLDIFDYEFVDNAGDLNDEIITNHTAVPAGGSMGVANHDFEIPQGARFHKIIVHKDNEGNPVDLTGYTAEMHVRKFKASTDIELTLSTSDNTIVLGGALGTITLNVEKTVTDDLDFKWAYYDLELYPGGDEELTIRVLEGRIELSKQVTRQ